MSNTEANQEVAAESAPAELGDMIAELDELRDRKRAAQRDLDEITEEFKDLENDILGRLDALGIEMTRTGRASVSVSVQEVPTVTDWDAVQDYIRENDALYLFQRRLGAGACQELWNSGVEIPGVEKHEKRGLNLRKNK